MDGGSTDWHFKLYYGLFEKWEIKQVSFLSNFQCAKIQSGGGEEWGTGLLGLGTWPNLKNSPGPPLESLGFNSLAAIHTTTCLLFWNSTSESH